MHLNLDKVIDTVYYSESSPSGLRWARDIVYRHNKDPSVFVTKRRKGDIAGSISGGYYSTVIGGTGYKNHRLIYSILKGDIGNLYIDHIDGNRLNNRIENLRATTKAGNARNRGRQSNKQEGQATGVYWHSRDNLWFAIISYTIKDKKVRVTKNFKPCDYDSEKDAYFAAVNWRLNKLQEANDLLSSLDLPIFSTRHIKQSDMLTTN